MSSPATNPIKTGAALWQLSKLLSESENDVWLAEHIDLFFLPMRCGMTFILSVVLADSATFGVDFNTMTGGTAIPIRSEYHGVPLYSLLKMPIDTIAFTDSASYNMTARGYMTEYNLSNVLTFLRGLLKRAPKNAHEGMLRDVMMKKNYDGMTFSEYVQSLNRF